MLVNISKNICANPLKHFLLSTFVYKRLNSTSNPNITICELQNVILLCCPLDRQTQQMCLRNPLKRLKTYLWITTGQQRLNRINIKCTC